MKTAERDYSHRTLFEKLGVRPDAHVAIVGGHDQWFVDELDANLAKAASRTLRTKYDFIFAFVDDRRALAKLPSGVEHLKPAGVLWIFHPKGRGASPNEHEVRAAALAAGLVDNKVCSYSDSHTATRYVIPVNRR
ncbi:MAG: DUF3052 family protein [Candidatus Eremiobacteraeota bacterium]|nr:DUF3052 family protein [Candidatus Eremiobacteraeota bacterium]